MSSKAHASKKARRITTRSSTKNETISNAKKLSSVMIILAENNFLGPRTLGSLERVCRDTRNAVLDNTSEGGEGDLWRILCCNKWPSTKQLNTQWINNIFGGYKKYYKHRQIRTPSPKTPPTIQPLPQPDLDLNDLYITVDVFDVNGNIALSHILGGKNMEELIQDGSVGLRVNPNDPYVVGNAKCFFDGGGCSCSRHCLHTKREGAEDLLLYKPEVMLINSKDPSTCRLFHNANQCDWREGNYLECETTGDGTIYDWKNSQTGWLDFNGESGLPSGTKGLPLQHTNKAAEIALRLKNKPIFCSVSVVFDVLEPGDKIGIIGYYLDLNVGHISFEGNDVLSRQTIDETLQKSNGVTIMNILDQLERVVITPNGPKRLSSTAGNNTSASNTTEEDSESSDDDVLSCSEDEDAGN